jgi:hypothetical protein
MTPEDIAYQRSVKKLRESVPIAPVQSAKENPSQASLFWRCKYSAAFCGLRRPGNFNGGDVLAAILGPACEVKLHFSGSLYMPCLGAKCKLCGECRGIFRHYGPAVIRIQSNNQTENRPGIIELWDEHLEVIGNRHRGLIISLARVAKQKKVSLEIVGDSEVAEKLPPPHDVIPWLERHIWGMQLPVEEAGPEEAPDVLKFPIPKVG